MNKLDELKSRFFSKALDGERLFLLSVEDAVQYILSGKELGLDLLGVEGFRVTEAGAFQPRQEASNDIAYYTGDDFVTETIRFIQNQSSTYWYQVGFSDSKP